jgi:hypothetical protein
VTVPGAAPTISGVIPASVFATYIEFVGIELDGKNFASTDTVMVTPDLYQGSVTYHDANTLTVNTALDRFNWNPGRYAVADTNSHGTSNTVYIVHRTPYNMMGCSPATNTNQCFLLDSINSVVNIMDRPTKSVVSQMVLPSNVTNLGLTYDDTNKFVVVYGGRNILLYRADGKSASSQFGGVGREVDISAAAAGNGYVCLADWEYATGANNLLFFATPIDPTSWVLSADVKSVPVTSGTQNTTPFAVSISKVGSQVTCTVFDISQNQLMSVNVPQGTTRFQITVSGIKTASNTVGAGGQWVVSLPDGGAVLIDSYNRVAIKFSATGAEVWQVALQGTATSTTLTSDGKIVVQEYDDPITGTTKFELVDPATGNITPSAATVSTFFPTGLDGNAAGNRDNFVQITY